MSEDWSELADELADNDEILIGKMDCTKEVNKPICHDNGVTGYPTLMYGDVVDLKKYMGMRELDEWRPLVEDKLLKPLCSVGRPDLCSPSKQQDIEELLKKGYGTIDKEIQQADEKIAELNRVQAGSVGALQKKYREAMKKKEADKKTIQSEIALLKSFMDMKTSEL